MKNKPIVAGNWKMNKTIEEGVSFVGEIQNRILDKVDAKVIFCPPFTMLLSIVESLSASSFGVGAQNVHDESQGAFTGEVSVDMLKSTGITYVILGHSERRHLFGESDDWINQKIHAVVNGGLVPIFCIGETLKNRKSGLTGVVLKQQIELGLKNLDNIDPKKFVIAYEPVWAIGTGRSATSEMVAETHASIRNILIDLNVSENVSLLYGGSVSPKNASELSAVENVDGFLIGNAALDVEKFYSIYREL